MSLYAVICLWQNKLFLNVWNVSLAKWLHDTNLKSEPQLKSWKLIMSNHNIHTGFYMTDCTSWFREYTEPKWSPHLSEFVNFKLIKISSCQSSHSSQLFSQVRCGEKRLYFSLHVWLCFALHHADLTAASRVCARTWILWQVQMLQYTSRTLIIEMKSLTGDFIKELARWQITEASEGQRVSSYAQSKTAAL